MRKDGEQRAGGRLGRGIEWLILLVSDGSERAIVGKKARRTPGTYVLWVLVLGRGVLWWYKCFVATAHSGNAAASVMATAVTSETVAVACFESDDDVLGIWVLFNDCMCSGMLGGRVSAAPICP